MSVYQIRRLAKRISILNHAMVSVAGADDLDAAKSAVAQAIHVLQDIELKERAAAYANAVSPWVGLGSVALTLASMAAGIWVGAEVVAPSLSAPAMARIPIAMFFIFFPPTTVLFCLWVVHSRRYERRYKRYMKEHGA